MSEIPGPLSAIGLPIADSISQFKAAPPQQRQLIIVGLAASGQLAAVSVNPQTIVPFGRPQMMPATVTMGRSSALTRSFDILPNGRFIGFVPAVDENESSGAASAQEIRVVLNWFDELKRLVPTP